MAIEKYMAKFQLMSGASAYRCRDNTIVMPELMVEVHETADGSVRAFALPPPGRGAIAQEEIDGGLDVIGTTLQQAGNNVLAKRNMELQVENDALNVYNRKLEEQNRELMDRLMHYADRALEVLHGEEPAAVGSRSRTATKKSRAAKAAEGSNGAEA